MWPPGPKPEMSACPSGPIRGLRWLTSVLAVAALLAMSGLAGAAFRQVSAVDAARERLAAAQDGYAESTDALAAASQRYREVADAAVALEEELRQLDQSSLEKVLAFESTLSRARELAVSAYVRGGVQSDLETYLDASEATEAVLRLHLVVGRVDQAQEAASDLRSQRIVVDAQAREVATEVAALGAQLDEADAALRRAGDREQAAYAELLAATDALAVAEGADAAARAALAAQLELAEERTAAERTGRSGGTADDEAEGAVSDSGVSDSGDSDSGVDAEAEREPFVAPPMADDDQADAWAKLRDCESSGDYTAIGGGGLYRGAYQFAQPTWESVGGVGDPAEASPEEQDYRARLLYERSGAGQWPLCGRYLR